MHEPQLAPQRTKKLGSHNRQRGIIDIDTDHFAISISKPSKKRTQKRPGPDARVENAYHTPWGISRKHFCDALRRLVTLLYVQSKSTK